MRQTTDRQLDFLDSLGYVGEDPEFCHVASMAIDMLKAGKSAAATERAVLKADRLANNQLEKQAQKSMKAATQKPRSCFRSCLTIAVLVVLGLVAIGVFSVWIQQ